MKKFGIIYYFAGKYLVRYYQKEKNSAFTIQHIVKQYGGLASVTKTVNDGYIIECVVSKQIIQRIRINTLEKQISKLQAKIDCICYEDNA